MQAAPTLNGFFEGTNTANLKTADEAPEPKKLRSVGKKCTVHFGCPIKAVYTEQNSGTLYCKEHKPRSVTVTNIPASTSVKKPKK